MNCAMFVSRLLGSSTRCRCFHLLRTCRCKAYPRPCCPACTNRHASISGSFYLTGPASSSVVGRVGHSGEAAGSQCSCKGQALKVATINALN
jgi:hypothetical protein